MFDSLSNLAIKFITTFDLQDRCSILSYYRNFMRIFELIYIGVWGFSMALVSLLLQTKHLLRILLRLEAGMICLFVLVFIYCASEAYLGYTSLILITLRACEASLGLSILISIVRARGNDYVSRFSSQKC